MGKEHQYQTQVTWTGAGEKGTENYRAYSRDLTISARGKPDILASSDPAFRGDPTRYNPEDMLVAATSSCHMLWYLHFCAVRGVRVLEYTDKAEGTMTEGDGTGGYFTQITLRPHVMISADSDEAVALQAHHDANKECFLANSLKCPVTHKAIIEKAKT